jgi:hypothetical protein
MKPGWFPDPENPGRQIYWDGQRWLTDGQPTTGWSPSLGGKQSPPPSPQPIQGYQPEGPAYTPSNSKEFLSTSGVTKIARAKNYFMGILFFSIGLWLLISFPTQYGNSQIQANETRETGIVLSAYEEETTRTTGTGSDRKTKTSYECSYSVEYNEHQYNFETNTRCKSVGSTIDLAVSDTGDVRLYRPLGGFETTIILGIGGIFTLLGGYTVFAQFRQSFKAKKEQPND